MVITAISGAGPEGDPALSDDERVLATEAGEGLGDRLLVAAVADAEQLAARPGRVGERSQDIEDGPLSDLLARADGVFHGGMELGREHETDPNLINCFANLFGCQF